MRVEADIRTGNLRSAADGLNEVRALDEQIYALQGRAVVHLRAELERERQTNGELKDELTRLQKELGEELDE